MAESSLISNKGKFNMASDADDSPVVPICLVGTTSQESTIPDLLDGTPSCGSIQSFLCIKLTSMNYLVWKMQFASLINCFLLQSFIDKAVTPPAPSVTCPKYMAWWRKDQMLVSWILSSLSEEIVPMIIRFNSSASIWESLEVSLGCSSESIINQLQMQLQNTKHTGNGIIYFLRRLKLLADKLAAFGVTIPLRIFNAIIYSNLWADYGEVVRALSNQQLPVTFNELMEVLTNHEIQLRKRKPVVVVVHGTYSSIKRHS